jgi:hypothetical protein
MEWFKLNYSQNLYSHMLQQSQVASVLSLIPWAQPKLWSLENSFAFKKFLLNSE